MNNYGKVPLYNADKQGLSVLDYIFSIKPLDSKANLRICLLYYTMAESILSSFSSVGAGDIINWMKTGKSIARHLMRGGSDVTISVDRNLNAAAYLLQYIVNSNNGSVPSINGVLILPNIEMNLADFLCEYLNLVISSSSIKMTLSTAGVYVIVIFTEILP